MPTPPLMNSPRVRDLVDRLSAPQLTTAEAGPLLAAFEGHEGDAALPLFSLLHDSAEPAVLRTVSRILARWSDLPVAKALVPALEVLLGEPTVAPLNKMAAAGLLEIFGSPVDYPKLVGGLDAESVGKVGREALENLLRAGDRPLTLSNAMEHVGEMSADLVLDLIDDLGRLDDARAEPILAALTHAADPEVSVAAVATLDIIGRPEAHDALLRVAAHHHDPTTRAQARWTLNRLGELQRGRTAAVASVSDPVPELNSATTDATAPAAATATVPTPFSATPSPSAAAPSPSAPGADPLPLVTAHGRLGEEQTARLLFLAVTDPRRPALHDVFVAVLDTERGLSSYATAEGLSDDALDSLRQRMAVGGEPLAAVSLAEAQWALQEATNRVLAREGRGVMVAHVVWLRLLGRLVQAGVP